MRRPVRPVSTAAALSVLAAALTAPTAVSAAEPTAAPTGDLADGYVAYMENAGEEFNPKLRVLGKNPTTGAKHVVHKNAVDVALFNPAVSPDGGYLTFNTSGVYVMKVGKHSTMEEVDVYTRYPSEASWSPTSKQFVFTATEAPFFDEREVYISDTKGNARRITSTAADEIEVAWSPDGQRIAVTARGTSGCRGRTFNEIFTMRTDGSDRQLLTGEVAYDWQLEDWGPTGVLANASYAGATGDPGDKCPADGKGAYVIDSSGATATRVMGDLTDRALALSPDGTGVLFHRNTGGQNDSVWVVDVDGSNAKRIATNTDSADWAAYPAR